MIAKTFYQEFLKDEGAASYVQWLERAAECARRERDEMVREKAMMEQAAQVSHEHWKRAEGERMRLAGLLLAARVAYMRGDVSMLAMVLEGIYE